MSYNSRYDRGDWKCICDACGRIVKASQLKKRWDGFMVDDRCWEPRQPQDFVRGVADYQAPAYTRPEPSNNFIPFTFTPLLIAVSNVITTITSKSVLVVNKIITITSTSAVTMIRGILIRSGSKVLNGSDINKTTLG